MSLIMSSKLSSEKGRRGRRPSNEDEGEEEEEEETEGDVWMDGLKDLTPRSRKEQETGPRSKDLRERMRREMMNQRISKQEWLSTECRKQEYMTPCSFPDQKFECVRTSRRLRHHRSPHHHQRHEREEKRIRMRKCRPQDWDRKYPLVQGDEGDDEEDQWKIGSGGSGSSGKQKRSVGVIVSAGPQRGDSSSFAGDLDPDDGLHFMPGNAVSPDTTTTTTTTLASIPLTGKNIQPSVYTNQKECSQYDFVACRRCCYCCRCNGSPPQGALSGNEAKAGRVHPGPEYGSHDRE